MGFLDNYLTVNQKVQLAHEKFPKHKIIANIIEHDLGTGYVLVQADFYRDASDVAPSFRDFAYGNVAFYPNQMKRWFVEDTTTSAIGRVLSVALGLDEKPNRETMEQVERSKAKDINADDQGAWGIKAASQESMPTAATVTAELEAQLGSQVMAESPICQHGHMIFKHGEKNGREWGGWFCTEKTKGAQCDAVWAVRSATTGNWRIK
jgi:hypothetical protein